MKRDAAATHDLTPLGRLGEGAIHVLLGYQLAQSAIVTTDAFVRVVGKPLGLRPVEFTILQLTRENAAVTPTNLAKALGMTVPGVKIWLDRLEQRGLVRRAPHETDRRSQRIELTHEGTKLLGVALPKLLAADQEILRNLSVGERHLLIELLHKVARARTA